MEKYTFFYGGPFSQWANSIFLVDGVEYVTAEQYMMAQKALLFKDIETHAEIMRASEPYIQKALGRKVKNFNKSAWEFIAKSVVYRANYAKFSQDKYYYDALLKTKDTLLVEASAEDKIWGIGLAENDPRVNDKSQWQGTNWLGQVLTDVREDLIFDSAQWDVFLEHMGDV